MHKPWFNRPKPLPKDAHIVIVGGGISGITLLHHLTRVGFKTTLIEKNNQILAGASGNPAALLDPYLSASDTIEKTFYMLAYKYAQDFYGSLGPDIFQRCTLQKIATSEQEKIRFTKIAASYDKSVVYQQGDRLKLPSSGYIKTRQLKTSIDQAGTVQTGISVDHILQNKDRRWSLFDDDENHIIEGDAVILANACDAEKFEQSAHLKLDKIGGQITYIKSQYIENNILCSDGYLMPSLNVAGSDINICGATFEKNISLEITEEAHRENIKKSPIPLINPEIIGGRRGIRAMSQDHLPISGPAPDYEAYLSEYSDLHHGPRHKKFAAAAYHKNLFISTGLGARGFLTAPLLAHYLSVLISGGERPFDDTICHALHPARFIVRKLSKK